jgi:hypothetical protein
MGPLYQHQQMLPHVGQAYDIASQMLAPGFDKMGGGTDWGDMLRQMIAPRATSAHPGMPDAEYAQAMQGIGSSAQGERARMMSMLAGQGGGSVDPGAAAAAMSRISAGVPTAVSNLAAKRSQMDLQAMMGLGGLMGPLGRQELVNQGQFGQQYGQSLQGLAGNILGSGIYGNRPAGQAPTARQSGGFMGIPGVANPRR